ncbi:MAG: hypothetical protein K6F33_00175 [Bacteroidales bacterium]|nr:hypothetical protein [Bacteroidales bacterium]
MSLNIHKSSVISCLIGLLLLMTGFVGYMAHSFSKYTAEMEGEKVVELKSIHKHLHCGDKGCLVSSINADDIFEMPDNHQKAIKGRLYLCAIWPDSSQNVLIDWNKKSQFMRIPHGCGNGYTYISPRNIECGGDTSTLSQLKIKKTLNNIEISYFKYKFTLSGIQTKGEPKIVLQRECMPDSAKVALVVLKNYSKCAKEKAIEVLNVVQYDVANNRKKSMSQSKITYIIICVIGILMFFVPERQAINTIENTMNIVNKIINH